jgi:hypothetical protein
VTSPPTPRRATPPRVDALLLCERIDVDHESGKPTLVGVTDTVVAPGFPAALRETLIVYANMTGLRGRYRFHVEVVAPDLATVVSESTESRVVETFDPIQRYDVRLVLGPVDLAVPGRYGVRLLYDDILAAEFSLPVDPETP